jgi:hypothetical protein
MKSKLRAAAVVAAFVLAPQASSGETALVRTRRGPRMMPVTQPCAFHYIRGLITSRDPRAERLRRRGATTYEGALPLMNTSDGLSIRREAGRACGYR